MDDPEGRSRTRSWRADLARTLRWCFTDLTSCLLLCVVSLAPAPRRLRVASMEANLPEGPSFAATSLDFAPTQRETA